MRADPPGSGASAVTAVPVPTRPVGQRSSSPVAVVGAWIVVLLAVLVLLEYWRWVLLGAGIVAATAALGLLIERYQERHRGHADRPGP